MPIAVPLPESAWRRVLMVLPSLPQVRVLALSRISSQKSYRDDRAPGKKAYFGITATFRD